LHFCLLLLEGVPLERDSDAALPFFIRFFRMPPLAMFLFLSEASFPLFSPASVYPRSSILPSFCPEKGSTTFPSSPFLLFSFSRFPRYPLKDTFPFPFLRALRQEALFPLFSRGHEITRSFLPLVFVQTPPPPAMEV